jgi:hypothetical protein
VQIIDGDEEVAYEIDDEGKNKNLGVEFVLKKEILRHKLAIDREMKAHTSKMVNLLKKYSAKVSTILANTATYFSFKMFIKYSNVQLFELNYRL